MKAVPSPIDAFTFFPPLCYHETSTHVFPQCVLLNINKSSTKYALSSSKLGKYRMSPVSSEVIKKMEKS